jgi:3-oxoacyl-[acyl-carrier protein] reductase
MIERNEGGVVNYDTIAEDSKSIPLQRFGDPAEFARVAVFLSSPAASYVTGVAMPIDGGLLQSL